MAYSTGSSTGPSDLLAKLKDFLVTTLGWTLDSWADDTFNVSTGTGIDGTGKRLHVHKTAADGTVMYFNFRSAVRGLVCVDSSTTYPVNTNRYYGELTGIAMNGSTGYGNASFTINSISNMGGGQVYVNCTSAHYFSNGASVTITGTPSGQYDGTYTITNASGTGFNITHAYGTTVSSGTVSGPSQWFNQPGNSGQTCSGITELSTTAIPSYYFFADGDTVVVAVEYTAGKFQFLCFGCLEKQGVYTGGQFFTGSFKSNYFYYDWYGPADTVTSGSWYAPWFFVCNNASTSSNGAVYVNADADASWRLSESGNKRILFPGCMGSRANANGLGGFANFFIKRAPNFYNSMAAMCPLYVLGKRSDGNYSLLGWQKSIRQINVSNYSPGQELTYGSETWKVFPATLEPQGVNVPCVKGIGFAIKKVS